MLFVDADSTLDSATIDSCLKYVQKKNIEMFSLSPRVEIRGIVARAVLPLISGAINILYPMQKVNDKNSDRAYVFGTFILVKRDVYASTGGHERVKNEIVEDAAIARITKASGSNLRIERGSEFVSTQWESDPHTVYDGLERVTSTSVRKLWTCLYTERRPHLFPYTLSNLICCYLRNASSNELCAFCRLHSQPSQYCIFLSAGRV